MMNDSNKILSIIDKIRELSEIEIFFISIEINNIIDSELIDQNKIENIFDRLLSLDFIDEEKITILYFKLLDYYKTINIKASKDYEKYYNEKYEEEEKNKSMIKKI